MLAMSIRDFLKDNVNILILRVRNAPPSFYQDNIKIQFTDTHVKVEGFSMSNKRNKQKLNWIKLCEKEEYQLAVNT